MNENFKKDIEPMIKKVKNLIEFEEFLEKEVNVLGDKIFYKSKSEIDNKYFKLELLPRINRINKIISYIDSSENMESKNEEISIQIEALKSMKNGNRFLNIKNIFRKDIERLEKMGFDITSKDEHKEKIEKEDNGNKEGEPIYWWDKKERDEEMSAEIWERTHKK